jgi:hypothetical protein
MSERYELLPLSSREIVCVGIISHEKSYDPHILKTTSLRGGFLHPQVK